MFNKVKSGTIKLFKTDKGYGFITNEKGDVFFHINDCSEIPEEKLVEGTEVRFEITTDKRNNKKRAEKIVLA